MNHSCFETCKSAQEQQQASYRKENGEFAEIHDDKTELVTETEMWEVKFVVDTDK